MIFCNTSAGGADQRRQRAEFRIYGKLFSLFFNILFNNLRVKLDNQVPVRTFSGTADKAPLAMARLTADNTASSDAVMMFGCIPAPNNVCRERVVISI